MAYTGGGPAGTGWGYGSSGWVLNPQDLFRQAEMMGKRLKITKIVQLKRDDFLQVLENAHPDVVFRQTNVHFFIYERFVVYTFECRDEDFTQPIKVLPDAPTEPDVISMREGARHQLQEVRGLDFLQQLADTLDDEEDIPKIAFEDLGAVTHCPKCHGEWTHESPICTHCGYSLYNYIDLPRGRRCWTCMSPIPPEQIVLSRQSDGHLRLLCPHCHNDLRNQDKGTLLKRWIILPIILLISFIAWAIIGSQL